MSSKDNRPTDAAEFVGELGGGVMATQLGIMISDVCDGVIRHNKAGQITITLNVTKNGDSNQVNISHTLKFKEPTAKGSRSEDTTSSTPMHVNADTSVTLFANHTKQMMGVDKSQFALEEKRERQ